MKYRALGKTGVQVSEIGFGCGDNAWLMVEGEPSERRAVVSHALDSGINYFDTSNNYGEGKSETNLGATLKELGAAPFVATKVRLVAGDFEEVAAGIQAQYNVLNPTEGRSPPPGFQGQDNGQTIERAAVKGMGVVAYRALAAGALAQKSDAAVRPSPSRGNAGWNADIERARALDFLRGEGEDKLAGAAVRYVLSDPNVSSVLLGFSRKEYIDEANAYSDAGPLAQEQLARIEALYQSDFGRAQKAAAG